MPDKYRHDFVCPTCGRERLHDRMKRGMCGICYEQWYRDSKREIGEDGAKRPDIPLPTGWKPSEMDVVEQEWCNAALEEGLTFEKPDGTPDDRAWEKWLASHQQETSNDVGDT